MNENEFDGYVFVKPIAKMNTDYLIVLEREGDVPNHTLPRIIDEHSSVEFIQSVIDELEMQLQLAIERDELGLG